MNELLCKKHGRSLEYLGGCSAHASNWFCPDCDKENKPKNPIEMPDFTGKTMSSEQIKRLFDNFMRNGVHKKGFRQNREKEPKC